MPYEMLWNGAKQKSLETRSGLILTPSRCTSLHKNRYDIKSRNNITLVTPSYFCKVARDIRSTLLTHIQFLRLQSHPMTDGKLATLEKVVTDICVSLFCTSCTERVKLYHQVEILIKH